jgi:hypothetical protein
VYDHAYDITETPGAHSQRYPATECVVNLTNNPNSDDRYDELRIFETLFPTIYDCVQRYMNNLWPLEHPY